MKFVFLGPPGAGKGTQAKILAKKLNIPAISTGDIFRDNIKDQSELGKKAVEYTSKGLLVPDHVTNAMAEQRLMKLDCANGFILDGYPRTINQAKFLDEIETIDKVINFVLTDDEVIRRISGRRTCKNCAAIYHIDFLKPKKKAVCDKCLTKLTQREDDKPKAVKKRLQVYKKQTEPLIEYYTKKEILVNVDSSPTIKEISKKVEKTLQ